MRSMILLQNNTRITKVTATTLTQNITAAESRLFKLVVRAWYNNVMKADFGLLLYTYTHRDRDCSCRAETRSKYHK